MNYEITTGYSGIFRPPFIGGATSTIYCLKSPLDNMMILIPLSHSSFSDMLNIIKKYPSRELYIVIPDIGVNFVSDYANIYYYISKVMHRQIEFISSYMPENHVSTDFKSAIQRSANNRFEVYYPRSSDKDLGSVTIEFSQIYPGMTYAPFANDIYVSDGTKRILFVTDMNKEKCDYLSTKAINNFDELHMPFITGNYGGMSFQEVQRLYPELAKKIRCNLFANHAEYMYSLSTGAIAGKEYGK